MRPHKAGNIKPRGAQLLRFGANLAQTSAETRNPTTRSPSSVIPAAPRAAAAKDEDTAALGRGGGEPAMIGANKNPGRERRGDDRVPSPPRIVDLVVARLRLSSSTSRHATPRPALPPPYAPLTRSPPSSSQSFAAAASRSAVSQSPSIVCFCARRGDLNGGRLGGTPGGEQDTWVTGLPLPRGRLFLDSLVFVPNRQVTTAKRVAL
nr:unnamed protein product [Digitaria exilis]